MPNILLFTLVIIVALEFVAFKLNILILDCTPSLRAETLFCAFMDISDVLDDTESAISDVLDLTFSAPSSVLPVIQSHMPPKKSPTDLATFPIASGIAPSIALPSSPMILPPASTILGIPVINPKTNLAISSTPPMIS